MAERQSKKEATIPWRVPLAAEDVAEAGSHFELAADADTRAAIAKIASLRDLPRLQARFDVSRHGAGGFHVTGGVSATVGQLCVVTLEPLANEVAEKVDLLFLPRQAEARLGGDGEVAVSDTNDSDAEPLIGGTIDLGAIATEFLILGLDPYPRKPGAVFQPLPEATPAENPFAALAALNRGQDEG
jgi:uncharacterized metal-binding protein YceD (DUF177 family)